jgi:hypothetical protein
MINLGSKGIVAWLHYVFTRSSGYGCPECGGFMRECQTSIVRGGRVVWRADAPHGKKCVECGFYVRFVRRKKE